MNIDLNTAELVFVGSSMADPETAAYALDLLKPNQLSDRHNRIAYGAIQGLLERNGDPSDSRLLLEQIKADGFSDDFADGTALQLIAGNFTSVKNLPEYADIIKREGLRARLKEFTSNALRNIDYVCPEQIANDLASDLANNSRASSKMRGQSMGDMLKDAMAEADGDRRYISTGFGPIDSRLGGGLSPTSFTIVAAGPSFGKTAFAVNLVNNATIGDREARCLFITMEMGGGEVSDRMISLDGGIPLYATKALRLNEYIDRFGDRNIDQLDAARKKFGAVFTASLNNLATKGHKIKCDGLVSASDVRSLVSYHQDDIDYVILDYIQQIKPEGNQKTIEKINEISWTCKDIAMRYKKPVIALSQFSRGGYKDNCKPQLSDLRESGQLEQDADNVFLLWREKKDDVIKEDLEVNMAKNRSGPIGICNLTFELNKGRIF